MSRLQFLVISFVLLMMPRPVHAVSDAALFRLFLLNGETVTSYGEFARIDDRVIFSMPVGGSADQPRLQVVTLPAGLIDWARTQRHVDSSRFQRYATARGDEDFRRLTADVAQVLNQIALTTDRREALAIAEQARRTLADWPRAHFGYRQDEVRDVIGVLDNAISALRGTTGVPAFELSLVVTREPIDVEPLAQMPSPREQLDQIFRVVSMTSQATERVALLQSAIALLNEAGPALTGVDVASLRRSAETLVRQELAIDARYARLVKEMSTAARQFAASGRIAETERLLDEIQKQDAKLGRHRPEVVVALQASVQVHADSARQLRLLRDRWKLRRSLYSDYQRSVGSQLTQLAGSRPQLESIRRLDGPELGPLQRLRTRLSGGAERLTRLTVPEDLKPAHNLLVSAWRFAENAARGRYEAVASGNLGTAREASSAAAGALMMLSRAQEEIRSFLEPPRLP